MERLAQKAGYILCKIFFPRSFHQASTCVLLTRYLLIPYIHSSSIDITYELNPETISKFSHFLWSIMADEFSATYVNRANIIMDKFFQTEAEKFLRSYRLLYFNTLNNILKDRFGRDLGNLIGEFLEFDQKMI